MSSLATAVVAMLSALLPLITGGASTEIDTIINVLIQLIPQVVQEVEQVGPIITNIITALKGSAAITPAQLTALQAVEAQYDAAFEVAASAAGDPLPAIPPVAIPAAPAAPTDTASTPAPTASAAPSSPTS